ncbi:hypothetical protein ACP70R_009640 [Stipagrostis hirtigluma subsp. patula]
MPEGSGSMDDDATAARMALVSLHPRPVAGAIDWLASIILDALRSVAPGSSPAPLACSGRSMLLRFPTAQAREDAAAFSAFYHEGVRVEIVRLEEAARSRRGEWCALVTAAATARGSRTGRWSERDVRGGVVVLGVHVLEVDSRRLHGYDFSSVRSSSRLRAGSCREASGCTIDEAVGASSTSGSIAGGPAPNHSTRPGTTSPPSTRRRRHAALAPPPVPATVGTLWCTSCYGPSA